MSVAPLPIRRSTQAAPDRPCPRFCSTHHNGVHAGDPRSTFMVDGAGRRAHINVWLERRDQADGTSLEVAVLSLDGREFDMPAGRLLLLAQQLEETAWTSTPKRGNRFQADDPNFDPDAPPPPPTLTVVPQHRTYVGRA
ncbi:hypothetical protein AB0C29_12255 [Actinoplanes sp. NPDC048791]|uniref:hypothetical protein n=1 Tax=Actinoplanes sp. NPDC048791 TaxID=3154623 RepID=UPI0034008A72